MLSHDHYWILEWNQSAQLLAIVLSDTAKATDKLFKGKRK